MEKKQRRNDEVKKRSYLDWAATAIPMVLTEENGLTYGNPSSVHGEGRMAKAALESARSRCAAVLGVPAKKLYFSSGGTESNAIFLHSLLLRKGNGRLLYSELEHPSVRETCQMLGKLGLPVATIAVEKDGRVSEATLSRALEKYPDTRFAAVMGVNNEVGSLMDIKALVSLIRLRQKETKAPIHFHADMVQAIGKVPVELSSWDLDSASFSAHKLGGPRGIGLLYLKKPIESFYAGGEQEGGIRPGTENTSGALALAELLEKRAKPEIVKLEEAKAAGRFKYLIEGLKKIHSANGLPRCSLIPEDREEDDERFSPWILQARFHDVPGAVMVRALDEAGVAVSTGSACSSNSPERPVLSAMGIDESARLEGIRISQGWLTEMEDMDALLSGIEKALSFL
ncbi:MAG: cysteine desulfurase [Treponema sp.]|nr:cysteine desulfurase [Treponema sp.]